jgi:hypothetical protein
MVRRLLRWALVRPVKLYVVLSPAITGNFEHVLADGLSYTMWKTEGRRCKYLILYIDRLIKET